MAQPANDYLTERPGVVGIAAAVISGTALWLSRAAFDIAGTTSQPERVAMLPSLPELAGLVVLALLVASGMAATLRRRSNAHGRLWTGAVTDAMVPAFCLSLLALPYLPWISDWLPAVRLLAGPGR
jgi:hypothetical protein